jgi:hypothetical protein
LALWPEFKNKSCALPTFMYLFIALFITISMHNWSIEAPSRLTPREEGRAADPEMIYVRAADKP